MRFRGAGLTLLHTSLVGSYGDSFKGHLQGVAEMGVD